MLLKDFSFAVIENNTFVDATLGAIHFAEPEGNNVLGPGRGAAIDGNIFVGAAPVLLDATAQTEITLKRSIVPPALVGLGVGNIAANPLLVDPSEGDFSVQRGSPALGAGPGGTDIGAVQTPRYAPATSANLRVTELHYHPLAGNKATGEVGGDAEEFEFIELQNVSEAPIDLTDVRIADGVEFTFPWLASLAPGEIAVLVSNRDLFESRYGTSVPIFGAYDGHLANSGEKVQILAAAGATIADVSYGDDAPWPRTADGAGPSLETVQALGDPSSAVNWRASANAGGSPGVGPPVAELNGADFDADGDVDGNDFLRWQRGLGTPAPSATRGDGDADHDADVDGADLGIWQSNYGTASAFPAVHFDAEPDDAAAGASAGKLTAADLIDIAMAASIDDDASRASRPRARFRRFNGG